MTLKSINPFDGSLIKTYEQFTKEEVSAKILDTHRAWLGWKKTSFAERAGFLRKIAQVLRNSSAECAMLMAEEMGKPLADGYAEIEKCAACCEYYAKHGETFLKEDLIETEASKSYASFQPLGVILAVMPWNFPYWQLFRFLAPALMAGNCAVLKHSSNVSGCAISIEKIVRESGILGNVLQTLLVGSDRVEGIIENPLISAVTLTGSTNAGRKVAQKAGSMLKKSVLELGGSDPYLILADADLEEAAKVCAESRLINSGQSCIAAKRFIVVKEVADNFTGLFKSELESKVYGDPKDEKVVVGPQARVELRDELHRQVQESIDLGAKCLLGGTIPPGNNAMYPPTLLTNVKKGMPVYDDETFGPVAAVIIAQDTEDAIRIANDTCFGLGAAIFSADVLRAESIAKIRLEAGSCFINEAVRSDPRLPFGGIKDSGFGRELSSYGIREFTNIKTILVR